MLANMLDKEFETKPVTEVIKASPAALQGISDTGAEALQKYLGIKTIEDMASNKFFLWAQAMTTISKTIK